MRSGTGNHNACKPKLRKGLWSPEEDEKLVRYITKYGHKCWSIVPKQAGLQRCGKSCRLRWINYLRPDLKRGQFSQEEEDLIIKLHSLLGNRWAQIATQLPGRTDNEIKNFWNSCLRKKLRQNGVDPVTHKPLCDVLPAKLGNMIPPSLPSTSPSSNSSSSLTGTATTTTAMTTPTSTHVPRASRPPMFKQQISGEDDTETSNVNSFTMSMLPIKFDAHGEDGWSTLQQQHQQQQQQELGFIELPGLTNSETFSTIFSATYEDHVTTSSEEDSELMDSRDPGSNNNGSKILFPFWEPCGSKPSTTTTISSNNVSYSWPFSTEPVLSPLLPPSSPPSVLTRCIWPLTMLPAFDSLLETSYGSSHGHGLAPDFYDDESTPSRDGVLSSSAALLSSVLDRI